MTALVPVALLIATVSLVAAHGDLWMVVVTGTGCVVSLAVVNPLGVLDEIAPRCRNTACVAVVAAALAVILPTIEDMPMLKPCLAVAAAVSCLLVWLRWAVWQADWAEELRQEGLRDLYLQCPEVDRVLGKLTTKDTDSTAWEAWSDGGMRQTRALYHQSLGYLISDEEIERLSLPVWLLAWVVATQAAERQEATMRNRIAQLEQDVDDLRRQLMLGRQAVDEAKAERGNYSRLHAESEKNRREASIYRQRAEELEQDVAALQSTLAAIEKAAMQEAQQELEQEAPTYSSREERNAAMAEFRQTHTLAETAEQFGLTVGGVKGILSKMKAVS